MISVAMTTYNGESFIKKQIESILNQTITVDEIIICDDCSTDRTLEILSEEIQNRKSDIIIKIIRNKVNLGYIQNFYKAIKETNGDIIFLADQDDIWELDKVEKCIKFIESNGCDAICSKFKLINENGDEIIDKSRFRINKFLLNNDTNTKISFNRLIYGNISPGCTYCFNKKVKDIYLKINDKNVIHDYQIMLIAATIGSVELLTDELIKYRLHSNNSVGFSNKTRKIKFKINKLRRRPIMVEFLYELNKRSKVPFYEFYILLYYLRIPYIKAKLRRLIYG
ncbi:glycosyltransferase family 2 protein [Clostridium perfringens]|uniref:glycosyltransferase family 2 protein n=1 Tax=Clostridium perfringens TaxID=1502 RepID=UPI0028E0DF56|nr:glycosyltransferase family 2 protein [Clostridium perfringens]MDT9331592.1 glycosyltransferase family 2 protein [Clostridium perfringens]